MNILHKLRSKLSKAENSIPALIVVLAVAGIGVYFIVNSHATTPYVATSASNGTSIVSPAGTVTDSNTSSGKAVQFGCPTGETGTPGNCTTGKSSNRSPYSWPFTWDSIWNIPISSSATYVPATISLTGTYETSGSWDYDSISPSFPVKQLTNAQTGSSNQSHTSAPVYSDPNMAPQGEWNTCSAFLSTDGSNVYQGETTDYNAGANPAYGGQGVYTDAPVAIEGEGITGCHGASGLSGLGGTLTAADMSGSGPIQHSLKVMLDCINSCSNTNGGFVWPAGSADTGYTCPSGSSCYNGNYYGGSNVNVKMGSMLALPPSISPSSFTNPTIQRIATAFQDYGAYVVDDTAWSGEDSIITNYNAAADFVNTQTPGTPSTTGTFGQQLDKLFEDLDAVTNNAKCTPGGGATGVSTTECTSGYGIATDRYALYAPEFTDGTDAPPTVTVVNP